MKKSPKQRIIELSGISPSGAWKTNSRDAKAKILDQIASVLEPKDGESTEALKARLLGSQGNGCISNKKLLKLHNIAQRLKSDFGGSKANLVDVLVNSKKGKAGKVDEGYRQHLNKKSIATLLLLHDHAKKAGELS